jgi:hypothetical protein
VKRADVAFVVWATLAAVCVLVTVGFIIAAAYMEVTR